MHLLHFRIQIRQKTGTQCLCINMWQGNPDRTVGRKKNKTDSSFTVLP